MEIKDLIGFQLVEINNSEIKLKKDDKTFTLSIITDNGGCCGYNFVGTNLFISKRELNRNPIITDITIDRNEGEWEQTCKVVLFGEEKNIAELETNSGSGSGWCYGACAWVKCKELDLDEVLSQW